MKQLPSSIKKKIEKWDTQTETPAREILRVLQRLGFEVKFSKGGHIVAEHPSLIDHYGFGKEGKFTIPTIGGRRVKRWYAREALRAIRIVMEAEDP